MIDCIEIKNFASIKKMKIKPSKVNTILGKNGSGKTNLFLALNHFYVNLESKNPIYEEKFFDINNPFNDEMTISITYDVTEIKEILSVSTDEYLGSMHWKLHMVCRGSNKLTIKMKQFKTGEIKWSQNSEIRFFIKEVFPIHYLDIRGINLNSWDRLWDLVSQSSFIKTGDRKKINQKYKNFLKAELPFTYEQLVKVEKRLDRNKVGFEQLNKERQNTLVLHSFFSGTDFRVNDYKPQYHSAGVNSLNFIKIFISLIKANSEFFPLNYPIILLDEPEIGLHPHYIDDLTGEFERLDSNLQILINTHSTRLVKNIISRESHTIFNARKVNNISYFDKFKKITDIKLNGNKFLISEKETAMYFSDKILFVEGRSEIELFTLPVLLKKFPELKHIEILEISADASLMSILDPHKLNFNAKILILIDIDKILTVNSNEYKLSTENINPLQSKNSNSEIYHYTTKRDKTFNNKKKIKAMIEQEFEKNSTWHYFKGNKFNNLIKAILEYSSYKQTYSFSNTLEGAVVNIKSLIAIREWMQEKYPLKYNLIKNVLQNETLKEYSPHYKNKIERSLLLITFSGKFEDLSTVKQIKKQLNGKENKNKEEELLFKFIQDVKPFKKANGWIPEFFEYFFNKYSKDDFIEIFPEIYDIIKLLR